MPAGSSLGPLVLVSSATQTPFTNLSDIQGQSGSVYLNAEVEPRVATDPTNPMHLVGVWQQDRWTNGGSRGIMSAVSFDGGNTWTPTPLNGMTVNEGGTYQRASDPWVTFAPNGDVYASSLVLPDPAVSNPVGVFVDKSTDGGRTWGSPSILINNYGNGGFFNDKDSITADPTNALNVYAVWDRLNSGGDPNQGAGPTLFSRTTDGGQTWSQPADIYDPGSNGQTISNQIVVEPNGTLICMFVNINYSNNSEQVDVIRSTDQGQTWSAPIEVSPLQQVGESDPDNGAGVRAGDIPDIAVNPKNGKLYVVFQTGEFSNFAHDDIALSYSSDGGMTWSTAFKVNTTPTSIPTADQQAFTPNVAAAPNGRVAVGYYDFRNNTSAPGCSTDYWLDVLTPTDIQNGVTGSQFRMTKQSFNMEKAPNANGYFVGDYEGLTVGGQTANSFGAFFAVAHTTKDPTDIYFRDPGSASPDLGIAQGATPVNPSADAGKSSTLTTVRAELAQALVQAQNQHQNSNPVVDAAGTWGAGNDGGHAIDALLWAALPVLALGLD